MSQSYASREIRLNGSLGFLQMHTGVAKLRQPKKEKKEGEIMKSLKANVSMLSVVGVRSMGGSSGRRVPWRTEKMLNSDNQLFSFQN